MSINICVAQNVRELDAIIKSIKDDKINIKHLPLNLETYLYCMDNDLEFINPAEFIDNKFHRQILVQSDNFVNSIIFPNKISETVMLEAKSFLRFRFYSVMYIFEIFKKLRKLYKIDGIITSGWKSENHTLSSFFLDDIFSNLFQDIKILRQNPQTLPNFEYKNYTYKIEAKINNKNKNILLGNLGYNFKRIIINKIFNFKYKFYVFEEKNFNIIKKIIFKFLRIKLLRFKKIEKKFDKTFVVEKINYTFNNENIEKLIKILTRKLNNYFLDLGKKKQAVDDFLHENKFSLILTNTCRTIGGLITENSEQLSPPTVCISHGTIVEKFDLYDEIYKKIIASSVFSGQSKYFAIQSKIAFDALKTHKLNGKPIITGNLIFSQLNKNIKKKKKYILFAVTLKDFHYFQFLGVEMYYEFIQNLNFFAKISKENNLKFIIKMHPSVEKCIKKLKKIYPNLIFRKGKIDNLLKKSFLTISFSSTVIEDSLNSQVPVILFDQWKRYRHCDSEVDYLKNGEAIYYVNEKKNLVECIENIKKNKNFNFSRFTYDSYFNDNIKDHIFSKIT